MDLFDVLGPIGGTYLLIMLGVLLATGMVRKTTQQLAQAMSGDGSIPASSGLMGSEVVQRLLAAIGLPQVGLERSGRLNCYHAWRKTIQLRPEIHDSCSLTATAIAAHEVGHAQQFATDYFACRLRRIFCFVCWVLLAASIALPILSLGSVSLPYLALWLLPLAVLCLIMHSIIYIPLEWDASRRARALVQDAGLVNPSELPVFDQILTAAGRTHLAAHAQRWVILVVAIASLGWGIPGYQDALADDDPPESAAVAPAPPPAVVNLPPEGVPPVETIDITLPLLSIGALLVPVVLVMVVAALMQTEGRGRPSIQQQAVLRNNAGQVLFNRGQLLEAIREYTAALQLDRQLIAAHYNRGTCYFVQCKFDEALVDLDAAVRLAPGFIDALVLRGEVWNRKGDTDRALVDMNEALRLSPGHSVALSRRGNVWLARGKLDAAIADFTAALERGPAQADVLRDRGLCWLLRGVLYRAAADLDESIRLNPADAVALNNRGAVFLKAGDYRRAVADLDEAIRLAPEFPNPHKHLAWLRATCPEGEFRNGSAAVASATRALELTGWKSTEWLGVLAAAHAEAGEWDRAIDWQAKCLEASPAEVQASMRERLALYQAGHPFRDKPVEWSPGERGC